MPILVTVAPDSLRGWGQPASALRWSPTARRRGSWAITWHAVGWLPRCACAGRGGRAGRAGGWV